MLTETSYHAALAVYLLSAAALLLLGNRWLLRGWPAGPRLLLSLLLAALLLTPALAQPGAATMAPALLAAALGWLAGGEAGAAHALRPLGVFTAAALAAGVAAWLLLALRAALRRRRAARHGG